MFGNPFSANVERKMTKEELVQAIRADLSGELEAIYGYDAHVQATDDPVAKAVLSDIRDEERAHMGELLTLLKYLDPQEGVQYDSGAREVEEMLEELGITPVELPQVIEANSAGTDVASTVGSLKE
ncbi:ubiquinone biosynthesis protein COQ7 [Olsenella sp. AM30-3LB]|jgi:rubrerythrin|nr:ubiquinone biosynthesis protein COQ7 [Olsenella sp. AM30-3LB]